MARKKSKGESPFTYFRRIFGENPQWLEQKSNKDVIDRYRTDHNIGADEPVEKRIKDAMANTKSLLKKKNQSPAVKRGRKRKMAKLMGTAQHPATFETLEYQIDDCLSMARRLDAAELENVIKHLRKARNEVVWMLGEP
jgi:protoporphyrinogen oxidase